MQTSAQDHADQVLHDQLLAAQHHLGGRPQGAPGQQQHLQPNNASPRDQPNIDPAISGAMLGAPQTPTQPQGSPPSDGGSKSYGKRELSTSKRAAQNRAAQRAFRQRKETYIRKLEEEVKNIDPLKEQVKSLVGENYQLREYIINLQSRLLEAQGEVPELPANIDLSQPRTTEMALASAGIQNSSPPGSVPTPGAQGQHSSVSDDMNSLNRIAAATLGMRKHPDDTAFLNNNSFQQNKRVRTDDSQDGNDGVNKQEIPHGLPMVN
ncbi:transcriptional regulator family: bZIP [Penicillium roqueforti]|nr:transcriptional regulator family: bZIP [Penicillium roqueforti]KAF9251041.1 transcriptional regulator family: bZIP [Penicillium roqueforti]KAI1838102.1 transcriptional regulator family: bZIP [Penicillium roqueforti]KAI2678791.1 transcriptional regulator family: bZIP [Penicillium roqueforti]KAI2692625.1 transcriptional regulator family: bZIP [Penicillium roqueforti]KAI2705559.1 transcriptional regulator family: bZIP [Penicillium roqueforti]